MAARPSKRQVVDSVGNIGVGIVQLVIAGAPCLKVESARDTWDVEVPSQAAALLEDVVMSGMRVQMALLQ